MIESEAGESVQPDGASAQVESNDATRHSDGGMFAELSVALTSAHAALSNFLELMSLEARRAGLALTWMIMCGVVAAMFIVTAWMGIMLAVVMGIVALGIPTPVAVVAVAAGNAAAATKLIYVCIGMSKDLLFSATQRQLAGQCPVKPSDP
ncbi:hypothetical protein AAKU67_004154 [Oxalobacteraceae bacterium GrIS 2.11]